MTAPNERSTILFLLFVCLFFLAALSPTLRSHLSRLTISIETQNMAEPSVPLSSNPDRIRKDFAQDLKDQVKEREAGQDMSQIVSPDESQFKNHSSCIFYDRPPRTGSTTISRALSNCLSEKGYKRAKFGGRSYRRHQVNFLLALEASRVVLVSNHVAISLEDITNMRKYCERLIYISSCRKLVERLRSARVLSTLDSPVPEGGIEFASERYKRGLSTARMLDRYPFVDVASMMNEEDRVEPDYVIRNEKMEEDLGKLIRQFGCNSTYQTRNTHVHRNDVVPPSSFLVKKGLEFGDRRYEKLRRIAERVNEKGLEVAASFV